LIDVISTNTSGQATIDLENGEYVYSANKTGYALVSGGFTVSGSAQTIDFTMNVAYTVTFNETNGLEGVDIGIYDYIAEEWVGYVTTNATGQATIDLENSEYMYEAAESGYASAYGEFTVFDSTQTIDFTMNVAYEVTFDEANDLQYVYIEIYNSSEEIVGELETDVSGNASISLPNDAYEFYAYMDGYIYFEGNFTVSGGPLTVPFEMIPVPFVTFNETNGLSNVYIDVYADSALTDYIDGFWTDSFGQATIGFYEAGTYYYEAIMTGYGDLVGDFTVSVSNITESFTMQNGYYVLFIEDNSEMAILQLFSDSGLTIPASSPFATNEGGNGTRELANGTYYYKATRVGFDDCTGNFTVSGEVVYEHFEMIPTAGVIFAEDFLGVGGGLPVGWTTNASSLCYVRGSDWAGGYVPELALEWTGGQETYSDYYVATPPIDATGISGALNLSFRSYFDLWDDYPGHPYTYAVQTSNDDGVTWTTVLEESPTFDIYPDGYFQRTENIDISACAGQTFRICWRLYGYTYWMDYWYIDDILVTTGTGELLTGIGPIIGTAMLDETLTAGTLSPAGATATYQWQRCSTVNGTYTNIFGATSNTYVLVGDDGLEYIKVVATGTGAYTGTVTSAAAGPVLLNVWGIGPITGSPIVGNTFTAGEVYPTGATATATYQWQRCSTVDGTYTEISGATSNTYVTVGDDVGKYVKVKGTGTGLYGGQVTSEPRKVWAAGPLFVEDFYGVDGVPAGFDASLPAGWNFTGSKTSTGQLGYVNDNSYAGGEVPELEIIYDYGPDESYNLSSDYRVSTPPIDATAVSTSLNLSFKSYLSIYDYRDDYPFTIAVEVSTDAGTTWNATDFSITINASSEATYPDDEIPAQTVNVDLSDYVGQEIMISWRMYQYTYQANRWNIDDVVVTGAGEAGEPLTGIGAITGTPEVGQTLTAGNLTPPGATATYQWQSCATINGTYSDISGAISNTYNLIPADKDQYVRVSATGYGDYTGTVTSEPVLVTGLPLYTITFNVTNAFPGVSIAIYNDGYESMGFVTTNGTGQATIDLPNDTYRYYASKSGYAMVWDEFVVSDSAQTITFTMYVGYTVTFNETNGLGYVAINVYSDPDRTEGVCGLTTYSSGQGTAFLADGTYYYLAMREPYVDLLGNFTVSGAPLTVNFEMNILFEEHFDESDLGSVPDGWTRSGNTDLMTVVSFYNAGGTSPELYFHFGSRAINETHSIYTPSINATGVTGALNLSFKHLHWYYTDELPPVTPPYSIAVEVSTDGGTTWGSTSFAYSPTANIGPETVSVDLGAYKGYTINIRWSMSGYTYWMDGWWIDDIVVTTS